MSAEQTITISRYQCGCDYSLPLPSCFCEVHLEVWREHLTIEEEIALLRRRLPHLFDPLPEGAVVIRHA